MEAAVIAPMQPSGQPVLPGQLGSTSARYRHPHSPSGTVAGRPQTQGTANNQAHASTIAPTHGIPELSRDRLAIGEAELPFYVVNDPCDSVGIPCDEQLPRSWFTPGIGTPIH